MARLTTTDDLNRYNDAIIANGQPAMRVGELIFTPEDDLTANGNIYNKSAWPSAINGAAVWIKNRPGGYGSIEIGSSSLLTLPSDPSNPTRINFFDGPGIVTRTSTSLAGREVQLENFNHLKLDFETHSHPGMRDGMRSGMSAAFGLKVSNGFKSQSAMALKVENSLGTFKTLEIRGCYLQMGSFAQIRASFAVNDLDRLWIERCILGRTVGGEPIYLGSTVSTGTWPNHRNLKINDIVIICSAAEGLQAGQIASGSDIHNCVIVCVAMDYRDAFEPFQDTGMQADFNQGGGKIRDTILWGFGSSGIHLFSKDASGQDINFGTEPITVSNCAIGGGKKGHSVRVHNSFTLASKLILRNIDIFSTARTYSDVGSLADYHYDMDQSTVPVKIIGGTIPNDGYPVLNPGGSNSSTSYFNITRGTVDEPQFVNSGFEYIDTDKITKWSENYGLGIYFTTSSTSITPTSLTEGGSTSLTVGSGLSFVAGQLIKVYSRSSTTTYFYGTVNTYSGTTLSLNSLSNRSGSSAKTDWDVARRIPYTTTDFVWLAESGMSLDYNLYKCILAHDSFVDTRPDLDSSKWELVYWDSAGRSMYDPAYTTAYTTDPMTVAGDFRLVKGSYHHLLGRGLSCNEQREDQTMYGWQWKDEQGTIRDIPGAYNITMTIADYSYLRAGRQYRGWVKRMSSAGVLEAPRYSDWKTI